MKNSEMSEKEIAKKLDQLIKNEGLYSIKEKDNRSISFTIDLNELYDIARNAEIKFGGKYKLEVLTIDDKKDNDYYFQMKLVDEKHVYELKGKVSHIKMEWLDDNYNKDRLVIVSGLYTIKDEKPARLRDMSENELIKMEYLIKKDLLTLLR